MTSRTPAPALPRPRLARWSDREADPLEPLAILPLHALSVPSAPHPTNDDALCVYLRQRPVQGFDRDRSVNRPSPGQLGLARRTGAVTELQKPDGVTQLCCPFGSTRIRQTALCDAQSQPCAEQDLGTASWPHTRCRCESAAPDKNTTSSGVSGRAEVTQDGIRGRVSKSSAKLCRA